MVIDRLVDRAAALKSPICVGLDTKFDYLPDFFLSRRGAEPALEYAAENIFRYNSELIGAVADIVPCVKVQSAYYEMYGHYGVRAFRDTIRSARRAGLVVIADIKRNDIGATAEAYGTAYLGETDVQGEGTEAFGADFVTVNGYLGTDGVAPFVDACKEYDRGIFVLVKTSNASSGELQDLIADGKPVYEHMADMVAKWGEGLTGERGYSAVGAVVGATYPEQAARIRDAHPGLFVLIPGYGAQGGSAEGLLPNFDKRGGGGVVNNSRAILTAWRNEKYAGMMPDEAARAATLDMRRDILDAFAGAGIAY